MKHYVYAISLLLVFSISCTDKNAPSSILLPGEWEEHESIWIGWEHRQEVIGYHEAIFDLIRGVHSKVPITIAAPSDSISERAKSLIKAQGIPLDNLRFVPISGNRYWIRDHGPIFARGPEGQQMVLDFKWVREGEGTPYVDRQVAAHLQLNTIQAPIFHEGGAMESNGAGTILLVEAVTLGLNPDKSKAEIEAIYREAVGAKKIIWLPKGLANDPNGLQHIAGGYYGYGVGGHIDEFARFVSPNALVLAWVDEAEKDTHPINTLNYEILSEAFDILATETDQDGKPFTIVKIPLPGPISKRMKVIGTGVAFTDSTLAQDLVKGDTFPAIGDTIDFIAAASYNNFLLTNGTVVLPTYAPAYSSRDKEERVKNVFSSLFPERELVWVDCLYQNYRGGGIHCSTQQQPKR